MNTKRLSKSTKIATFRNVAINTVNVDDYMKNMWFEIV